MTSATENLSLLGRQATLPQHPDLAKLELIRNPHPTTDYLVRFTAPEFTSLCPATGQPDFARIVIDYIPAYWLIESKALKLFLGSFRNHGAFHEDVTLSIGLRLTDTMAPKYFRIAAFWYPRGGIPIDVFWQNGDAGKVWLPGFDVEAYRGR